MNRHYAAALLLLGVAACAKPETAEQVNARLASEAATARAAIAENNAAFERYMAGGHVDSVGTLYAPNARVRPGNQPVMNGREAVVTNYRGQMGLGTWHISLATDSVWANGPLVVETGKYTFHFARGPSAPAGMDTTGSGSYMIRWVKDGDRYVIAEEIVNSDQPLPPPPPRRR